MNKPSTRVSKPCAVGKPKERKPGIQNIHTLNDQKEYVSKELAGMRSASIGVTQSAKPIGISRHPMPVRIGLTIDPKTWRCGICTFLNDVSTKVCQTCDSAKGETRKRGQRQPMADTRINRLSQPKKQYN